MNQSLRAKRREQIFSGIWLFISFLAISTLILKLTVLQQVNVVGDSMDPSYHPGDKLLLNKRDDNIKRGQVVSFFSEKEMKENSNFFTQAFPNFATTEIKYFLKRVIALPGEEIQLIGSKVIIYNDDNPNGVIMAEPYIDEETKKNLDAGCGIYPKNTARITIPKNHYYLMGDNRCNSLDSRDSRYGPFDKELFFGKQIAQYWPSQDAGGYKLPDIKFIDIDPTTESIINKFEVIENE